MFDVLHYKVTCEDREKFPAGFFCPDETVLQPNEKKKRKKVQPTVGRGPP